MMGEPLEIVSPVDGSRYRVGAYLSRDEALERLARAESAFSEFRETSVEERVELCRSFLNEMDKRTGEFAREVSLAMGKPLAQAVGEIGGMKDRTESLCERAARTLEDLVLPPTEGVRRFVRREPLGVVLDIAAWNYPYVVAINVVVPAVLAGNAVLLKHAPQTACVGRQFEETFAAAGAPQGLVQDFMASHETVEFILQTKRIAHVGFTGSVRGGSEVYARVARAGFTTCGLEMGGKDAALVLDDVDVPTVATSLVDGAFYNAGQSCCAVERIYVPRKLHEAFVEAFVEEAHRYVVDSPLEEGTTLGPVVNRAAAKRIQAQVDDALARGAAQVTDDRRFTVPNVSGCYLPPRVFANVSHDMDLMREESFGPIIGIMAYDDVDEGVRLVNDSSYGLTGSIWTRDEARAVELGDRLEVGTVYMNRSDAVDADLPWVGVKHSGMGFTLSQEGIVSLTRPKSFHLKLG